MQALQPVEDWGRDPLFSGFRKLLIVTIRNQVKKVLANELFLLYLCGRGISKVEIVGWIMSVQIRPKKVIYYIDDGTAPCMRCTKFLSSVDPLSHTSYKPGDIVSCKGVLALSETNEEEYGFSIHISCMET
eukprot:gene32552-36754_t